MPDTSRTVTVTVDGIQRVLAVEDRTLLSDALRRGAGTTGVHVGCEQGACGACTVVVDGLAVRSCLVLAAQADGSTVTTVAGIGREGELHAVQEAMHRHHGLQCGFCTPGIVVSIAAALDRGGELDDALDEVLGGHLCRCTGYVNIRAAVVAAWSQGPSPLDDTGVPVDLAPADPAVDAEARR